MCGRISRFRPLTHAEVAGRRRFAEAEQERNDNRRCPLRSASEHNRNLLRAFAVIGGDTVIFQEIVNRAIEDFFENACDAYMRQPATSESMRRTMAELNPQEC